MATGLTPTTIQQIERAQRAAALLGQGVSILDTVFEAGYAAPPNQIAKTLFGQTTAQIANLNSLE